MGSAILLVVHYYRLLKSLKAARQDAATSLTLTCAPDMKFTQIPADIPPVFLGEKLVMYGLFPDGQVG